MVFGSILRARESGVKSRLSPPLASSCSAPGGRPGVFSVSLFQSHPYGRLDASSFPAAVSLAYRLQFFVWPPNINSRHVPIDYSAHRHVSQCLRVLLPKTEKNQNFLINSKMCDVPTASVFTTHETHRSWIVFKTENGSKNTTVEAGIQSTTTTSTPDGTDPDLDKVYLLLEPHLRPATPETDNPQSVALFDEHKQLAQEYFKVQTDLAYLSQKKNKLLAAQSKEQQTRRKTLKDLQAEKESLVLVRELLSRQRENANAARSSPDNWVMVPREGADNAD